MSDRVFKRALAGDRTFSVPVAGECFRADSITEACLGAPRDECVWFTEARLLSEPDNPQDPNAVMLYVGREHCGYLPRSMAERLTQTVRASHYNWINCKCPAVVVSHYQRTFGEVANGEKPSYTIWLDLPRSNANPKEAGSIDSDMKIAVAVDSEFPEAMKFVEPGCRIKVGGSANHGGRVYVNLRDAPIGHQLAGILPSQICARVLVREAQGIEVPAEVVSKHDQRFVLKLDLRSHQTHERLHAAFIAQLDTEWQERLPRLKAELGRKYSPKKPVSHVIRSQDHKLRKGQQLGVTKLPTAEEFLDRGARPTLILEPESQQFQIVIDNNTEYLKKVARLSIGGRTPKFTVAENKGHGYYTIQVQPDTE